MQPVARAVRPCVACRESFLVAVEQRAPSNDRCLVVFSDDWGRHPSSCQHLVRELLGSCRVEWINTIGTRGLSLNWDLVRRGAQKLLQWGARSGQQPTRESGPAPSVHNPLMYPGFRSRWQRRLNARLLANHLTRKVRGLKDAVVLSSVPITADLSQQFDAKRWVYYCVDDFSEWPGLDAGPLRRMEQDLVARADRIVAAGENLAVRIHGLGREAQVITHGIDFAHWTRTDGDAAMLAGLPQPIVLFWGLVDRRLDVAMIEQLSRCMSSGSIVLVGPQQDPDPRLARIPRVHLPGVCAYENLPALARAAAVLVMPYADLPVTRAMQPLKMKEYLATGRPVVVARLPAVGDWKDCMDVADDAAQFAELVVARLGAPLPEPQRRARERLRDESWRSKAAKFAEILFAD